MRKICVFTSIAVAACLLSASPANATVIYSNLGPNDAYRESVGARINANNSVGFRFTSEISAPATSIEVAAWQGSGPVDSRFSIYKNVGVAGLGDLLESTVIEIDYPSRLFKGNLSGKTVLTEGEHYWLLASVVNEDASFAWNLSDKTPRIGYSWLNGEVQNTIVNESAVRITSDPFTVPEPGLPTLLLSSLLLLVLVRTGTKGDRSLST